MPRIPNHTSPSRCPNKSDPHKRAGPGFQPAQVCAILKTVKKTFALSIIISIALIFGLTMILENRFIYFPSKAPDGITDALYAAADRGVLRVNAENVWLTAEDSTKVHGWYLSGKERPDEGKHPVVLWFHGNAGNIAGWYPEFEAVVALGADVLAVDYRGYGRSEGSPDEEGVYQDAMAAWKHLTESRSIPPERIVLFGFSLGGAVAVDLAAKVGPAGLVVQSSFTSVPDMAAALMKIVPRFLVRTQMDSVKKVPHITCPKLFIHSPRDDLVPYRLGRKLFESAAQPKDLFEVKGAGHNDTFSRGGPALQARLKSFFETAVPGG